MAGSAMQSALTMTMPRRSMLGITVSNTVTIYSSTAASCSKTTGVLGMPRNLLNDFCLLGARDNAGVYARIAQSKQKNVLFRFHELGSAERLKEAVLLRS